MTHMQNLLLREKITSDPKSGFDLRLDYDSLILLSGG